MTTAALPYQTRSDLGQSAQEYFYSAMRQRKFVVIPNGVEARLSGPERDALRSLGTDPGALELRFATDYACFRISPRWPLSYWDVKTADRDSGNYGIDKEEWRVHWRLHENGVCIIYAARTPAGEWYASRIQDIEPHVLGMKASENGGNKDFWMCPFAVMTPMEKFLKVGVSVSSTKSRTE